MVPTKGRIVNYVMKDGRTRPAMVTEVFNEKMVNLIVFHDGSNDSFNIPVGDVDPNLYDTFRATSASLQEVGTDIGALLSPNTWHWPVKESIAAAVPEGPTILDLQNMIEELKDEIHYLKQSKAPIGAKPPAPNPGSSPTSFKQSGNRPAHMKEYKPIMRTDPPKKDK